MAEPGVSWITLPSGSGRMSTAAIPRSSGTRKRKVTCTTVAGNGLDETVITGLNRTTFKSSVACQDCPCGFCRVVPRTRPLRIIYAASIPSNHQAAGVVRGPCMAPRSF
jgi:hypothetical protein